MKKKQYKTPKINLLAIQPTRILDVSQGVRTLNGDFDPNNIDESQKEGDNIIGL